MFFAHEDDLVHFSKRPQSSDLNIMENSGSKFEENVRGRYQPPWCLFELPFLPGRMVNYPLEKHLITTFIHSQNTASYFECQHTYYNSCTIFGKETFFLRVFIFSPTLVSKHMLTNKGYKLLYKCADFDIRSQALDIKTGVK